jgi:hypothetical protein
MRTIKLICLICLLPALAIAQQITRVSLTGITNPELRVTIEKNVSIFLTECNRAAYENDIPRTRLIAITQEAQKTLEELWDSSSFYSDESELILKIVRTTSGDYELRGIPIVFTKADSEDDDGGEIVLMLTPSGLLSDLKIAMDKEQYTRLLLASENIKDRRLREVILGFVENYRTAYNKKDIDFIQTVFSDDAIIIVGRVITAQKNLPDKLGQTILTKDQVEFIRLSKTQYITNLSSCFKKNAFVKVGFDDISIMRHPKFPEIYGVTLKQKWNSSNYSDEGYLFLMIDFKDEAKPIIWVRSWQPQAFTKPEDVIDLSQFLIR